MEELIETTGVITEVEMVVIIAVAETVTIVRADSDLCIAKNNREAANYCGLFLV